MSTAESQATRVVVNGGGVAVIELHRPEVRNAYNTQMGRELYEAFVRCNADDSIRAVVLTGAPPAFCAGADLSRGTDTFGAPDPATFSATALAMPVWEVRKPVVAAVNGHAIGLGFTLTLQCDIRLFANDASYGIVQVRRGVLGDAYSHWTLPRLVGHAAAAEIMLTGRTFDGHQAQAYGLGRSVPNDDVLPEAMRLAEEIALHCAPLSLAESKAILWSDLRTASAVAEAETQAHLRIMGHSDAREAMAAYLERRRPVWTGSVSRELPAG